MVNRYRLGVDIGGTFTDMLLMDESKGDIKVVKVPSTRWPVEAVVRGIRELGKLHAIDPRDIVYFSHGTTIAVNTLLERSGAQIGMLVTEGYRDVMELRRLRLPKASDFFVRRPLSLVPRRRVKEIKERILASGQVHIPICRDDVLRATRELLDDGVEALTIGFLHSYSNSAHELAAKRWIEAQWPELYVCTSSEIWPQQREYERFLISVINAYVGSRMRKYFQSLIDAAVADGVTCRIFSTKSNGGVMTVASAAERPVTTLLSGPSAGVIGSAHIGRLMGDERLVTFDMGGTSADISIVDGEISFSTDNTVGDFPVIMPSVDVCSIGAGGGSIAWLDAEGVLKVGPQSAGAEPGPACYGKGGQNATVTDAYLVTGLIDPEHFLGGTMRLYPELARQAIDRLGSRLGLDTLEAADAILQVTTANLYAEFLPQMARRGVEPRDFSILAYGGAGPMHIFMLARDLPLRRIIVPPTPGAMCALGCLVADMRADFVQTVWKDCADMTADQLRLIYQKLDAEAQAWLDAENVEVQRTYFLHSAEMCYTGQSFQIEVPLEGDAAMTPKNLVDKFHERHNAIYGYADAKAPTRLVDARVQIIGVTPKPVASRILRDNSLTRQEVGRRSVYERGQSIEALVYPRTALKPGDSIEGPAIIEQYDTTVYIPRGFVAHVDNYSNIVGEAQR